MTVLESGVKPISQSLLGNYFNSSKALVLHAERFDNFEHFTQKVRKLRLCLMIFDLCFHKLPQESI